MGKRRAKGEGSIYHSKTHNLWVAQITLPNGKRKAKYSKTQKEVKEWLLEQRKAVKDSVWVSGEPITVSDYLDRYINDVASHTLRPKTLQDYSILIRKHIKPEIGHIKLTALTAGELQSLYSKKLNEGYSRRTVQYIHAIIRRALNQAVKWGLVVRNVTGLVEAPRPGKKAPDVWSAEQVKSFFESVKNERFYPLYVLAVTTGMRQGELLGLRWEDVDLTSNVIHVRQTTQTLVGKGIVISEPKTEKARRAITLPDIAIRVLMDYQNQTGDTSGLIFHTSTGKPISARNLIRDFQRILSKYGLPEIRFHDLRHTSATLLLIAGVHPKVVQERLGHSRIDMTMDVYSHVVPSIQQEAADKMDALLK